MEIRKFNRKVIKVPDPSAMGRWMDAWHWMKTDDNAVSVLGKTYRANEVGWFDVSGEAYNELHALHGWFSRDEARQQGITELDDEVIAPKKPVRGKAE